MVEICVSDNRLASEEMHNSRKGTLDAKRMSRQKRETMIEYVESDNNTWRNVTKKEGAPDGGKKEKGQVKAFSCPWGPPSRKWLAPRPWRR